MPFISEHTLTMATPVGTHVIMQFPTLTAAVCGWVGVTAAAALVLLLMKIFCSTAAGVAADDVGDGDGDGYGDGYGDG